MPTLSRFGTQSTILLPGDIFFSARRHFFRVAGHKILNFLFDLETPKNHLQKFCHLRVSIRLPS